MCEDDSLVGLSEERMSQTDLPAQPGYRNIVNEITRVDFSPGAIV